MQSDGSTANSDPVDSAHLWSQIKAGAVALWLFLQPWAFRTACAVAVIVCLLACFVKFRAESNLLCVFLAYLPVWLVGAPFLGTFALGIVFACWRSLLLSMVMLPAMIGWLGDYRLASASSNDAKNGPDCLTVMTYNRGQGSDTVLGQFAATRPPDIVAAQDAGRRMTRLAALPETAGLSSQVTSGEFVLLSRWPVLENEPLFFRQPGESKDRQVGVRSVVNWQDRHVVIYNLHLPTPRDLLSWYARRGTFLYGIVGLVPGTGLHARHQEYLAPWKARADWLAKLADRIGKEQDPVVLVGDLNLPPLGRGYQELTRVLQDSHHAAGHGFGCTFPGNSKGLSSRIAPWLRIDQILASPQWKIHSSEVGEELFSQHLPVVVRLELSKDVQ
ncbi:MAG: endonuclease/exonuclease/phosphatase family protein [Prosthecobacter sp.]